MAGNFLCSMKLSAKELHSPPPSFLLISGSLPLHHHDQIFPHRHTHTHTRERKEVQRNIACPLKRAIEFHQNSLASHEKTRHSRGKLSNLAPSRVAAPPMTFWATHGAKKAAVGMLMVMLSVGGETERRERGFRSKNVAARTIEEFFLLFSLPPFLSSKKGSTLSPHLE